MTERNHDEIARRLRETGTVPAPDRLRAEVMAQVRAEPRVRPSRRSFFAPVLPYAAAAAVLAGLVLAISHLGGGSGSMSSGGAGASGGGGVHSPEATKNAAPARDAQGALSRFSVPRSQALKLADEPSVTATRAPGVIVLRVPRSLYGDYKARLGKIERRTPAGPTIRVILRRVP